MAFTSFTVRQTISDGGSALRRTNVTQDSSTPNGSGDAVSDSGLRADGYFTPVPQSYLQSTFEANVFNRTSIELNWEFGFTLVTSPSGTEPVEVMIRASNYGEPVTAGDGDFVVKVTANSYLEEYTDKNTAYIKEGEWVYYAMFVRYQDSAGDGFYERVATLSVQIPRDFGSTEALWSRVPLYYRGLDEDYATNTTGYEYDNGPLYRYVELFGWELDKIRTTIYDTMRINDPEVIHSSAINSLANQNGVEFGKEALGTAKLRAVLNNIGYLRRTKGTINSVESYISALSGCGVSLSGHINNTNWVTSSVFSSTTVNDVAYGNGRWVAVGGDGKTSTSTDGITWSSTTTVGNTRQLEAVAYGNGLWIAVGRSGTTSASCIYKSVDGYTWTSVFNSSSTSTYILRDVKYANGVWVAVGQQSGDSLLCTSTDGTNWTVKSAGITGFYILYGVEYGNNKWIVTSSYPGMITSTDNGSTWSAPSIATWPSGPSSEIFYSDNTWLVATGGTSLMSSTDNGVTWILSAFNVSLTDVSGISKFEDNWIIVETDGIVYTSKDTFNWVQVYTRTNLTAVAVGDVDARRVAIVGGSGYLGTNRLVLDFNVHPMRVNLFSDPFVEQEANKPIAPDTGTTQRVWTDLDASGREYGWGVYSAFSSDPVTDMTVSTTGNKLTVTLPALSGTATVLIYSRGGFYYNNDLTYYYSAVSSHSFSPRFIATDYLTGMEATSPPLGVTYFDSWNDSVTTFPEFKDALTNGERLIKSSIPSTSSTNPRIVIPVYKFNIILSSSAPTVLTFEKPLIEYKNSGGAFFTGDEPSGGFIPDPTGSTGEGLYDYHWGQNANSSPHTDFSYYTLDFARVKTVVDNVIENYIVPVNIVKNTDYEIRWDVLE